MFFLRSFLIPTLVLFSFSQSSQAQPLSWTVTASSQIPSLPVNNTVDGDPNTFWSSVVHGSANNTEWIQLDLNRLTRVKGLTLTPRGDAYGFPQDFSCQYGYGDNPSQWFTVPGSSLTNVPKPSGVYSYNFPGVVVATRIRMVATKLGPDDFNNYYFQLAEISVNEDSTALPFSSSRGGSFDANINAFWNIYGELKDGSNATYDFGNEPAWYDWLSIKYMWSETTKGKQDSLRNRLVTWPMCSEGYVWSWGTQHKWPTGTFSRHEENNAKYILGCWRYWAWTRDNSFFTQIDPNTVSSPSDPLSCADVSQGKTVQQKIRDAMNYLEVHLGGSSGSIVIENYGDTTGRVNGEPTNYWDNWRFGHKNAYDNIYYYACLEPMAQLEEAWGNPIRAAQLRSRIESTRASYNKEFWNTGKGRYIGCRDVDGVVWDFGFTFLNQEAAAYGIPSATMGTLIYDWLDGNRIIAGERSTGSDIYFWKWAARANTIAAESIGPPYWWEDLGGAIRVDTNAASFGNHLENGGAILYTSYFDVMGRLRYRGITSADNRFLAILDEFKIDQLRRDPSNSAGAAWVIGVIGEFPESGLVGTLPATLYAGLYADSQGLHFKPNLPDDMTSITIRGITFASSILDLQMSRSQAQITSRFNSSRVLYLGSQAISPGTSMTTSINPDTEMLISLLPELTPTPTFAPSVTMTLTPTPSWTPTPSRTISLTATVTPIPTATPTFSPTQTRTPSEINLWSLY